MPSRFKNRSSSLTPGKILSTCDNPAVRDLKIIAYAGVPLMVSGHALGAFCVIDNEPHQWSYDEVRMLKDLGECVIHEIELRTRLREADKRLKQLEDVAH